jgi:hypothetical protein
VRLAAAAYWHLQWLCHRTECEVSAMGVFAEGREDLLIEEFILVKQTVTEMTVSLDMEWWADKQAELFGERGIQPWRTSCWAHTHPAGINRPSGVDDATMEKSFGGWDFALMLILTKAGVFYGRLEFQQELAGAAVRLCLPAVFVVDWLAAPAVTVSGDVLAQWEAEFRALVREDDLWDEPFAIGPRRLRTKSNSDSGPPVFAETKGGDRDEQVPIDTGRLGIESACGRFPGDWAGF